VCRLDDQVHVPVLDRPVQHPHPKPALRPRNRPHQGPIEPPASKPKPSIDPKRHMHRHIVRKRLPRIVAHTRTALRPTGPFTTPPVPQPIEVKLRLHFSSSSTSLGRALQLSGAIGHVVEYRRYCSKSKRISQKHRCMDPLDD
jgi:hypothetical protein